MDAAQDLDKRALASPVLAGERMHPPAVKAEIDVAQDLDGPKAFRDPAKFNYRSHVKKKKSGVAGVQELKNLGFRRRFSRADACPGFSDKDLAGIYSATPELLQLLTPEF